LGVREEMFDHLRRKIESGEYSGRRRLPYVASLALEWETTEDVVRAVLEDLAAADLVFIYDGPHGWPHARVRPVCTSDRTLRLDRTERDAERGTFLTDAEMAGFAPRVGAPDVMFSEAGAWTAHVLNIPVGSEVTIRYRVYYADETPVQITQSYLPRELTRGTAIEEEDTGAGGLYARLEEAGHPLTRFTETVKVRRATAAEVGQLQLRPGVLLLAILRTAYSGHRPVEVNNIALDPNWYGLSYDLPVS